MMKTIFPGRVLQMVRESRMRGSEVVSVNRRS